MFEPGPVAWIAGAAEPVVVTSEPEKIVILPFGGTNTTIQTTGPGGSFGLFARTVRRYTERWDDQQSGERSSTDSSGTVKPMPPWMHCPIVGDGCAGPP
jgi:hypothetical protein